MAAGERVLNAFSTTLTAGVTAAVTTIPVVSTAGVATDGQTRIVIDNEIILCPGTGVTGTSFTGVTRGVEGSTAAIHAINAAVNQYVSRLALLNLAAAARILTVVTNQPLPGGSVNGTTLAALGFTPSYADSDVLILGSLTGYNTVAGTQINVNYNLDGGTAAGLIGWVTNEANSHKSSPLFAVRFQNLTAAAHTFNIVGAGGFVGDGNDRLGCVILELPKQQSV
jgi:hypothetical protein